MTKYQELINYYYRAAEILKDRLPFIPALQLTTAKTYYGSYWRKDNRSAISLSITRCWPVDHEELLDTCVHELLHTIYPDHSRLHTAAVEHCKRIVSERW